MKKQAGVFVLTLFVSHAGTMIADNRSPASDQSQTATTQPIKQNHSSKDVQPSDSEERSTWDNHISSHFNGKMLK